MDFLEKIFQKVWVKAKEKTAPHYAVELEKISKSIEVLLSANLRDSSRISLVPAGEFVGFSGNQLYLPKAIDLFSQAHLNRGVYVHVTLQALAAINLEIFNQDPDGSPLQQRALFLENCSQINHWLDGELPGFREFQNQLFFFEGTSGGLLAEGYRTFDSQRALKKIVTHLLARDVRAQRSEYLDELRLQKRNAKLERELFFLVPCLSEKRGLSLMSIGSRASAERESNEITTEKEMDRSFNPEQIDLNKEAQNPITHSFEKLETADDYQGGYKMDSGDDELNKHSQALEEVNFKKVTRGGESVQSIFRADAVSILDSENRDELEQAARCFFYPEWSARKNQYLKNYCRIFENPLTLTSKVSETYREALIKNKAQISYWRSRIQSLVNEPLWMRRLKEGDEVDLDQVVADFASLRSHKNVDHRWYSQKQKHHRQIGVHILFDQSMSSDSWVKGVRVLDVILDAITTAGLVFEGSLDDVGVSGTWSSTRHNCFFQEYKKKQETWASLYSRIGQVEPRGYTRLGPAIRHAHSKLSEHGAKKKVLILITDGKPTDLDGYEGVHGVQDVKKACLEGEAQGITTHGLIIDGREKRHFAKMLNYYRLLQDPKEMSEELFSILAKALGRK